MEIGEAGRSIQGKTPRIFSPTREIIEALSLERHRRLQAN